MNKVICGDKDYCLYEGSECVMVIDVVDDSRCCLFNEELENFPYDENPTRLPECKKAFPDGIELSNLGDK